MTEPKLKADKEAGNLSETTKTYLIDVFVQEKYDREQDITSKHMQKGLMVEEDSITLYSRVKKTFFKKNEARVRNEYIAGTPDLFVGESIEAAEEIIDIKSSWDIFTFFRARTKDVSTAYWWQLQGYMALTGATKARLSYCLVNTPELLISDEKRKLMYKMNVATTENDDYISACAELDKSMIYDDVPMAERVFEFVIYRDDDAISRIYDKVKKARIFLNELNAELEAVDYISAAKHNA
jgi:hypothetical protein